LGPHAAAELTPDQVLLLFNSNGDVSQDLARHYADARKIPAEQMLGIPFPPGEQLGRGAYDSAAAAVREVIRKRDWGGNVRCLVTFYGVPLRVSARPVLAAERREKKRLEDMHDAGLERLGQIVAKMEAEAGLTSPAQAGVLPPDNRQALAERYISARTALAERTDRLNGEPKADANRSLLDYVSRVEGRIGLFPVLRANLGDSEDDVEQLDRFIREAKEAGEALAAARLAGPMNRDYDRSLRLVSAWHGVLGLCEVLEEDIPRLAGEESHASFDSEMSLALRETYDLYRWQPNDLNRQLTTGQATSDTPRTLMVARIDAPSPQIARRMIDDAVAVERTGLKGTFYVDIRGLNKGDLHTVYDQDLLDLYHLVRQNTDIRVILDNKPPVFKAGSCPDAALYCGWYSVGNYVPAFTFVRGAVGVHIASFEAVSLRQIDKRYWCAGLLRDGVAVTLGPTAEPYLHTFPKPTQFFGLLLTGEYSLVECFYQSKPFNSWQFTLLGDPLYRPFAKNPQLTVAELDRFLTRGADP